LTKYAEWDRYTEPFGFISLPKSGLKLIIESLNDETIKQIAGQIGSRQSKELMMYFFKEINLDTFVSTTSLFSEYAGFGSYEKAMGKTIQLCYIMNRVENGLSISLI
jgi:hypothetical protein